MCGIGGIVDVTGRTPPTTRAALARMLGALRHRGPDGRGLYRDRRAALVHARLALVDPAGGRQPMGSADGHRWLVFNGEIYNHVELRAELAALGHRFITRSDTEVVLHAWERWGDDAPARFDGQWALALWDARAHRLVLARDRHGICPLVGAILDDGRVAFASEARALWAGLPELSRAFDPVGLAQAMTLWTPVAPRTAFAAVEELRPGHLRIVDADGVRDRAYWSPAFAGDLEGSLDDAAARLREALRRATEQRLLRADVEVGCYLSGGLDSAVVAALAQRAAARPVRTFGLRFDDAEFDEGAHQRTLAAHLGVEHHELRVTRRQVVEALPEACLRAERPLLRAAPAPMLLLARHARAHGVTAVLTGEGADEWLAGYDLFREGAVRRFWARAPGSAVRPRLLERLYPYLARSPVERGALARAFFGRGLDGWREPGFAHRPRWRATGALRRLLNPEVRAAAAGVEEALLASAPPAMATWSPLAQDQYLELTTLLSGYLLSAQGDRVLMASGVEGRYPYLGLEVVTLAGRLRDVHKLRGLDEKVALKRAAAGLVPEAILRRRKQPYRAPDGAALTDADRPGWVDDLLTERATRGAGVFAPPAVAGLWAKCRAAAGSPLSHGDTMALVAVLSTHLVWDALVARIPEGGETGALDVLVDRVEAEASGHHPRC